MMGISKLLIVNNNIPVNKKFESRSYLDNFFSKRKISDFSVKDAFFTQSSREAADYLLRSNPEVIGFLGGDGTFSSTLNDILKEDSSFLKDKYVRLIPNGSGNDKARQLYDSRHKYDSFSKYLGPGLVTDDYLLATVNDEHQRYVFNVAGVGLDAQSLFEFETLRCKNIPGPLKYFGAGMRAIHKLNGSEGFMNYKYHDEENSSDAVMFLFMLGKYFGGGMPINKRVVMDDGLFESVILRRGTNAGLYSTLINLSLFKKDQYDNSLTKYLPPANFMDLDVSNADKFFFESDGDLLRDKKGLVKVDFVKVKVAGKIKYLVD